MIWQKCQQTRERGKEWIREGKAHNQVRPSLERKWDIKNEGSETHSRHKRSRMSNRMHRRDFRSWETHEQQTSYRYAWKWSTHKAQAPPTCTQPIQEWWPWVRGKRGFSLAVRRMGEPILGFPLKIFWEKYPAGMTYHPKEGKMSWNH